MNAKKYQDKVVVVKETKKGKNLQYYDINSSLLFNRDEFISAINLGKYPRYEIRKIKGEDIPVSKKDNLVPNNLG